MSHITEKRDNFICSVQALPFIGPRSLTLRLWLVLSIYFANGNMKSSCESWHLCTFVGVSGVHIFVKHVSAQISITNDTLSLQTCCECSKNSETHLSCNCFLFYWVCKGVYNFWSCLSVWLFIFLSVHHHLCQSFELKFFRCLFFEEVTID